MNLCLSSTRALLHLNRTRRCVQLAVRSSWWPALLVRLVGRMVHGYFILPLLLMRFQQEGSYFPHPSLKRADLQGLIASRGAALQLSENVAAAPFGVGHQPGDDLLPLPLKGVFVSAPPAQDALSLLLLVV